MAPEELKQYGVMEPGEAVDQEIGEPGCDFFADGFLLTVYKAEDFDMAYWEQRRGNFEIFEPNRVASRQGIKASEQGAVGSGCRQIMETGGGSVSVDITLDADRVEGNDPCAKAMEIAQLVEPKLPE